MPEYPAGEQLWSDPTPQETIDTALAESKSELNMLKRSLQSIFDSVKDEETRKRLKSVAGNVKNVQNSFKVIQQALVQLEPPPEGKGKGKEKAQTQSPEASSALFSEMSDEEIRELEEEDVDAEEEAALSEMLQSQGSVHQPPGYGPGGQPQSRVGTRDTVYQTVFGAVQRLHRSRPNHPMFGEVQNNRIRAPLGPLGGSNEVSWHKKVENLAKSVERVMGDTMVKGSCWMLAGPGDILWQKKVNNKPERYATVAAVRLLCFLKDPTDENWDKLTAEKYAKPGALASRASPFCHLCHNGSSSQTGKASAHCINGIGHGFFGTPTQNNNMKTCAGAKAGRWTCPGHDDEGVVRYCIYVNRATGQFRPCRNTVQRTSEDSCSCDPSCWDD